MKVIKRNGTRIDFNGIKIFTAIEKAMSETIQGIDDDLASWVAMDIERVLTEVVADGEKLVSVEDIQDMVEFRLMDSKRPDVAKQYILYRKKRAESRKLASPYKLLDDEFISNYKHKQSNMSPLGEFVYNRTYSRYLPNEGRREYWWETVRRAVEYNCSLVPNTTKEEAQKLYDNMFNLKQFLSGRTIWVGGTEVAKDFPMSNFNCFKQDTEFLTKDGIKTFNDFNDGDYTEVLNGNGAWSKSQIKNFGKQQLVKLTVRRNGTVYTEDIYTTENHIWFVDKHKESRYCQIQTKDLQKGDILRKKYRYEHQDLNMCNIGIQHGIVFGDGTFDKKKGHCRISLIGKKQSLTKYFTTGTICTEGERDSTLIYGLPYNWKELPPINTNVEYIKGFIYGLLLTDGRLDGSVRLGQKGLEVVKQLQSFCEIIGLPTSKIKEVIRTNSNFGEYDNIFEFTIHKEQLKKHSMIDDEPKKIDWIVENVEYTDIIEDVWCVIEPKTHSFTLRGGIHTHNCSFEIIKDLESFSELLYLLMLGTGVGVRVLKEDVKQLPKVRTDVDILHQAYEPIDKSGRTDYTTFEIKRGKTFYITVGDSKNGWADAMKYYFIALTEKQYSKMSTIIFNYNNVRPHGEKLKTFGGMASGHEALKDMFVKIDKVIKNSNEKLKPIDCLDIVNIIGEGVVVGGTRRTAEVVLGGADDEEFINAKSNLYTEVDGEWKVNNELIHRSMSNNSIFYQEKPTREKLHWQIEKMRYSGEPAWINQTAGVKRRPNMNGANPCMEILLDDKGMCNLTTLNVMAFVTEDGWIEVKKLYEAQRLSARAGFRMTMVDLELPKWNMVQQRDRLIGCSLTGWQDMVNATKMENHMQAILLRNLKRIVHEEAEKYAKELGVNPPLLSTTLKPEGTLSQLPVVSSGVHYSHSPYYIRRVRINANDPIVKVCEELDYPIKAEVGQTLENCKTKVVEFPVKAPNGRTKYDVSAIEQLENYKMFMEEYVDHNCFSRDTRFITKDGIKSFENFNTGDTVTVLNGNGEWSNAKIVNYGTEELLKIDLKRTSSKNDNNNISINATPNHRWLVRKKGKNIIKTTSELLNGDKIVVNYLNNDNVIPSIEGVRHGIVYGDGSVYNANRANLKSQVYLIGEKRELSKYFEEVGTITERDDINQTRIYGLDGCLKSLPTDVTDINYLIGFIMGWIATDGSVDKNGNVSISTSDESAVQWLIDISTKIGLSIGNIQKHKGGYGSNKPNYIIPIYKSTLKKEWFVKTSQINRFNNSKHHKFYSVEKIESIENNNDVWCVEEPITNQFTLEHNILTFNCSITVHVRDTEWNAVEQWVWDNWDDVVAVSFLSLDDSFYDLMPYEAITEEEYLERKSKMKPFVPSLISKYEVEEQELDIGQSECSNGICPLR